jgi:hypothetical protein
MSIVTNTRIVRTITDVACDVQIDNYMKLIMCGELENGVLVKGSVSPSFINSNEFEHSPQGTQHKIIMAVTKEFNKIQNESNN